MIIMGHDISDLYGRHCLERSTMQAEDGRGTTKKSVTTVHTYTSSGPRDLDILDEILLGNEREKTAN